MPVVLDPIDLSTGDRDVMATILDGWIQDASESRREQARSWQEDLRTYEGQTKSRTKNWPWPNASNLHIPMKQITTDAIVARLHDAIFAHENVWVSETEDPDFVELGRDMEGFLTREALTRWHLKRVSKQWHLESVLLGTSFCKGLWLDMRRWALVSSMQGNEIAEIIDHYGPYFDPIVIENILLPPRTRAINGPFRCQWVAHVSQLTWDELKQRQSWGYRDVDRIKTDLHSSWEAEIKEERDRILGIQKIRRIDFDMFEFWSYFPIHELKRFPNRKVTLPDGGSETRLYAELVISYNHRSRVIHRVMENWNRDGKRPIFAFPYIPRVNSIYGKGVGRTIHAMDAALSTIHNQRIDNATIANTRVWKAKKNVVRDQSIHPGKIIWVSEMGDIEPMQHGEVYQSSRDNEMILRDYIERATGVVDYTLGKESEMGKYSATATSTVALLQEGNRKFNFALDDWRETYNELATWALLQYKEYGFHEAGILEAVMGAERAQRLVAALSAQSSSPDLAIFKFNLRASTVDESPKARMERNMVLAEMTERFYIQIMDLVTLMTRGVDAMGMPIGQAQRTVALEALQAGIALYKRVLYTLDVKDLESYLPNEAKLQEAILATLKSGTAQVPPPLPENAGGPGAPAPGQGGAGPSPRGNGEDRSAGRLRPAPGQGAGAP